jgi:hypothetical protein
MAELPKGFPLAGLASLFISFGNPQLQGQPAIAHL